MKRLIAALIVLALCAGLTATSWAAEEPFIYADGASVSNAFPFEDVGGGAWYHDAVSYVYYHGLMNGVSETSFQPGRTTTRAMVVTVLWRMAGSPAPDGASGFEDLTASWYEAAVAWAKGAGIANGVSDTEFDPDRAVTREQMAAFIARFAGTVYGLDTSAGAGLTAFPDGGTVAGYAADAMSWACDAGIITGTTENGQTLLDPKGNATRAQVATILMRLALLSSGSDSASTLRDLVANTAVAGRTNQIVVVVDHNLTLWERGEDGSWTATVDVYAGYGLNGLSYSRTEGDGTTPIGAFPLLYAFGRDENPGTDLEYRVITPNSYYSNDEYDGTYNTWVESETPVAGEHLMDYADLQYLYAIVIGYNIDPIQVGLGSAIFLHCKGEGWNTEGCVKVESDVMLDLLYRLNQGAWIIIVPTMEELRNY